MPTKVLRNGQLVAQGAGYLLHHCDRVVLEGAGIVREMFPSNLRLVERVPGVSMFGVSRARQHGGAVATVGLYFLAMNACGRPRGAADRAIIWLTGLVDWLWCATAGVPTDDEIRAASRAEQQAQNQEDAAQMMLHEEINAESLDRAIAAIEEEESRMRQLKLLLRRRRAAER